MAATLSLVCSAVLTQVVRTIAVRRHIVDEPTAAPDRKIHDRAVPLLGGLAPLVAFFLTVGVVALVEPDLLAGIAPATLWGLAIASALLLVGGILDDVRGSSPARQIVWPIAAALVAVAAGVGVAFITNPFGGLLSLDQFTTTLFRVGGFTVALTLWADLFAWLWLLGMAYTTKFLDGLDGLVAGVTTIGGFVVFFVSLRPEVNQPTTALLAIVLAGALLGFLPWNFHPARVFLGEAGSLWTGFLLGSLAIISGGKIATALLLMGIPILDVAWVIVRRMREQRSPFQSADRKHLHFRLLDVGFSHRGAVLFLYGVTGVFGVSTLFVSGWWKVVVLGCLALGMLLLGFVLVAKGRRAHG
ncbi:MAG: undecaprenyl/decaprenyl-phosphate alpha-N-acetylglucosaminyl 1-phosphate transferase [Candidatus Kerfeldbacteria bacterium]|nr:undecaprenyl/decaprenyl-phosphate alpha-N-acetylglucosaminyl 1-phosphate transferase [Candidatus Kerfeldbacteria bacterium]